MESKGRTERSGKREGCDGASPWRGGPMTFITGLSGSLLLFNCVKKCSGEDKAFLNHRWVSRRGHTGVESAVPAKGISNTRKRLKTLARTLETAMWGAGGEKTSDHSECRQGKAKREKGRKQKIPSKKKVARSSRALRKSTSVPVRKV